MTAHLLFELSIVALTVAAWTWAVMKDRRKKQKPAFTGTAWIGSRLSLLYLRYLENESKKHAGAEDRTLRELIRGYREYLRLEAVERCKAKVERGSI